MALDQLVQEGALGGKKLQFTIGTEHPECGDDEVFIDTVNEEGFHTLIGWETKRRGRTPQYVDGSNASAKHPDMFPVFAKKSEVNPRYSKPPF